METFTSDSQTTRRRRGDTFFVVVILLFSIEEAAMLDAEEEVSSVAHCGPLQDHTYVPPVSGDSLL